MTHHGDLYYEGKEFEIRLKEKKPGDLSDDLRTALGMPVGPNAHKGNYNYFDTYEYCFIPKASYMGNKCNWKIKNFDLYKF